MARGFGAKDRDMDSSEGLKIRKPFLRKVQKKLIDLALSFES